MQSHSESRAGFTLRDMLIGVAVIAFLIFLALPFVQAAREAARRNHCINNMKQLVLALHNYHDKQGQFPNLTSTQISGVSPASLQTDDNPGTGYSWLVSILPYLADRKSFDEMERVSGGFVLSPFASEMKPNIGSAAGQARTFAAQEFSFHRCPSQSGGRFASAPEYVIGAPDVVARSSYVALSATHLDCILGNSDVPDYVPPNGVIVPGPTIVTLKSIVGKKSRLLILAENARTKLCQLV